MSTPPSYGYPPYPGSGVLGLPLNDPLVPIGFAEWFRRIIAAVRRSFVPLLLLAVIMMAATALAIGLAAVYFFAVVTGSQLMPGTMELSSGQVAAGASSVFAAIVVVGCVKLITDAAAVFVVIRQAADEPVTVGQALRFGAGRALPLLGWSLLAYLMVFIGFVFLVLPGLALALLIFPVLTCVVCIDRLGIGRCIELISKRFWATVGRVLIGLLISFTYSALVMGLSSLLDPGGPVGPGVTFGSAVVTSLVVGIPVGVLTYLPPMVVAPAFLAVTYAELRYRHDSSVDTAKLSRELTAPRRR